MMKAIILAAGKGTRMRPYSNAVNKEMCLIGYSPIIEYSVRALADAGIKKIFIVLGERKHQIMEYLRDGKDFGVKIAYLYQDMKHGEGTAKAVETAEGWIDEDFIMVYGDSFFHPTDFFSDLIRFHQENSADVTMGLYLLEKYKEFGVVKLEKERVVDILEKPSEEEVKTAKLNGKYPINSGPMVFSPKVFEYVKRTKESPAGEYWITDTIRLMIKDGLRVLGYSLRRGIEREKRNKEKACYR